MNEQGIVFPPTYPGDPTKINNVFWFTAILPNDPLAISNGEWIVQERSSASECMDVLEAADNAKRPLVASMALYTLDDGTIIVRSVGVNDGFVKVSGDTITVWKFDAVKRAVGEAIRGRIEAKPKNQHLATHDDTDVEVRDTLMCLANNPQYLDELSPKSYSILTDELLFTLMAVSKAYLNPGQPVTIGPFGAITFTPAVPSDIIPIDGYIARLFDTTQMQAEQPETDKQRQYRESKTRSQTPDTREATGRDRHDPGHERDLPENLQP